MKIVYTALKEVHHPKLGKLTAGKVMQVSNEDGKEYLKSSIFVTEADWKKNQSKIKGGGK